MVMHGKVLITGGAGFLGRGIMRQAAKEKWPCEFTIYSRDEYKQHQCKSKFPKARYVLGDIRDAPRLELTMHGHDIVVHAAALKFVAESEYNVGECVAINVGGTQSVIEAAYAAHVPAVVSISTDKAVEPANTYGLTKALAERIVFESARLIDSTKYVQCRYGNVIGSTGSIIPVFKEQLETLGYVKVTSLNASRFWLSVDQAVDLIELALTQRTGSMIIPSVKAMYIGDIVKAIAGGSYNVIGLRPGEKLHEKLMTISESCQSDVDHLCYDTQYAIYQPDRKPTLDSVLYEQTSDQAEPMTYEEFEVIANDAATV